MKRFSRITAEWQVIRDGRQFRGIATLRGFYEWPGDVCETIATRMIPCGTYDEARAAVRGLCHAVTRPYRVIGR